MTADDVESVRIERRETNWDKGVWHEKPHPFSDVFIVARGVNYYSRLFHTLDDSPHARAAQVQDFLRRQNRKDQ